MDDKLISIATAAKIKNVTRVTIRKYVSHLNTITIENRIYIKDDDVFQKLQIKGSVTAVKESLSEQLQILLDRLSGIEQRVTRLETSGYVGQPARRSSDVAAEVTALAGAVSQVKAAVETASFARPMANSDMTVTAVMRPATSPSPSQPEPQRLPPVSAPTFQDKAALEAYLGHLGFNLMGIKNATGAMRLAAVKRIDGKDRRIILGLEAEICQLTTAAVRGLISKYLDKNHLAGDNLPGEPDHIGK